MDSVEPGGLGGTYGGSPIGCAAALAVLDVIREDKLLARAEAIGKRIRGRIADLMRTNEGAAIANLRGLGAMIAFDIVKSTADPAPDGIGAKLVAARAMDGGLVVLTCGTYGETVRILVPLTASDAILDEGLNILVDALRHTRTQ
jgi:4-aminobutyrate aminotransferase/(S)-3-amino-2-methylpropionate transaminase